MGHFDERQTILRRIAGSYPGTQRGGTLHTLSNISLSAGWGSTAAASIPVGGCTDRRGALIVTAGGAGIAARPTITVTFADGAWDAEPWVICGMGSTDDATQYAIPFAFDTSTVTSFTLRYTGTPVAGSYYSCVYLVEG